MFSRNTCCDDGGSKVFENATNSLPDKAALHSRRQLLSWHKVLVYQIRLHYIPKDNYYQGIKF
jgi:hypothetical protein